MMEHSYDILDRSEDQRFCPHNFETTILKSRISSLVLEKWAFAEWGRAWQQCLQLRLCLVQELKDNTIANATTIQERRKDERLER